MMRKISKKILLNYPWLIDILSELQLNDTFCANILAQIEKGNIIKGQIYKVQNKLLKRYMTDGDKTYETIVLPRALISSNS